MSGWTECTLGEVLTLQRGFDLPARKREQGEIPVIASTGQVGVHNVASVSGPGVVIGRSGSIGGAQWILEDFWPLNTTLWVKDFKENDPRFCYYLLKSIDFQRFNAGSGVPTLNRNHIHPMPVSIPTSEREQKRIGHILGTLDDKIELNRRMNRTLEAIARAIFKSWFIDFDPVIENAILSGKPILDEFSERAAVRREILARNDEGVPGYRRLFPDSFQDSPLGKIPKGWEVESLGKVLSFEYGKALKASNRRHGDVPVYGSNGQVGWHDEPLVPGPGIVVGRKGNPGTVKWVQGDFFPIDTTFYVDRKLQSMSLHFLFHALEAQNLPSLAADSAVPGLNRNIACENRLLLPRDELLAAFEALCASLLTRNLTNEMESRALAQTRNALLPRLLSGELSSEAPATEDLV